MVAGRLAANPGDLLRRKRAALPPRTSLTEVYSDHYERTLISSSFHPNGASCHLMLKIQYTNAASLKILMHSCTSSPPLFHFSYLQPQRRYRSHLWYDNDKSTVLCNFSICLFPPRYLKLLTIVTNGKRMWTASWVHTNVQIQNRIEHTINVNDCLIEPCLRQILMGSHEAWYSCSLCIPGLNFKLGIS